MEYNLTQVADACKLKTVCISIRPKLIFKKEIGYKRAITNTFTYTYTHLFILTYSYHECLLF